MNPNVSTEKPLSGCTVMVTRASHQASGLADLLVPLGAKVIFQPVIEILETDDWSRFDAAVASFERFSRVVLVSTNAAKYFFSRVLGSEIAGGTVDLSRVEFAAIGSATAAEVSSHGVRGTLLPERADSASLADLLEKHPTGGQTMVIRADRGSSVLSDRLKQAGCPFEEFAIYRSRDVTVVASDVLESMENQMIHWTTVTSSAIGASLLNLFGTDRLENTRLASISPTTTAALESLGLKAAAEANPYSMNGLVNAIIASSRS